MDQKPTQMVPENSGPSSNKLTREQLRLRDLKEYAEDLARACAEYEDFLRTDEAKFGSVIL